MIATATVEGVPILSLKEPHLTADRVEELRVEMLEMIGRTGGRVVLDLSAVTYLDSSGVGLLVAAYKRIARDGGALRVAGLEGQPLAVVRTVSLDRVIALDRSVEEAVASLTGSRGGRAGAIEPGGVARAADADQLVAHTALDYEVLFGPMPPGLRRRIQQLIEAEVVGVPAGAASSRAPRAAAEAVTAAAGGDGGAAIGAAAGRLRSVLGLVAGRVQFLRLVTADPKILGSLDVMERAAMEGLAALALDGQDAGAGGRPAGRVPLRRVLDEALEAARAQVGHDPAREGAKGVRVIREFMGTPQVVGDERELRQAFQEILVNALEAMREGGALTLSVRQSGSLAVIVIEDTGRGLPAASLAEAFDSHYSTKGVPGAGLGLPLARAVVERHTGTITLESEPGRGTAVTVRLPASAAGTEAAPAARPIAAPVGAGPSPRVLVVDDEAAVCDLMEDILGAMGCEVVTCPRGEEGVAACRAGRFDLVMTDLAMPGMDGWEVARGIRGLDPDVPVALFSAWGSKMDAGSMQERGVDFLFPKPFEIAMVGEILASALELGRRRRGPPPAQTGPARP